MSPNNAAFEYVTGLSKKHDREQFRQRLASDPELQRHVDFWQQQLSVLDSEQIAIEPAAETWENISAQISQPTSANEPLRWYQRLPSMSSWWLTFASMCLLVAVLVTDQLSTPETVPNTDYVAVLTDEQGQARLTALTTGRNKTLWLQWQDVSIGGDSNLQIWAKSRRDGIVRPITVVADTTVRQIALDQANWRLIQDAHSLLLTEEEVGGSAIDEPSDLLIASGICVRYQAEQQSGV